MKLKTRYSAGLVIIYKGMILLGHTTGRKGVSSYGIPKGGIEEGESKLQAAIRETQEELGIKVPRKLIDPTEYTFTFTSRRYKYNKVVYYYIVNITNLAQIGLKSIVIPKRNLQIEEIDWAGFLPYKEAKERTMQSQQEVIDKLMGKGLLESKTIAGLNVQPNQESNDALQGKGEDDRLHNIRRFKGTVMDFKSYWEDRIKNQ
jgi:8-oxo-dGTP pyrophosphatase MutT (NUDIX family)